MSMTQQASREATMHSNHMAHMMRSSQPPRLRPIMIILIVLSLGMFFIGLVMTIIAFWPGHSSIGQDPLEIAGPILLSIGAVATIILLVLTCYRQSSQRNNMQRNIMANMYQQNQFNSQPSVNSAAPSMDAKPGKSILKKTPSTSTYGRGSDFEDDSGVANTFGTHSYSTNQSYEPESENSDTSKGAFEVYRIEALPDPVAANKSRRSRSSTGSPATGTPVRNGHVEQLQSSTDSEVQVPVPMRTRTRERKRTPQKTPDNRPSYSNEAYTMDGSESPEHRSSSLEQPRMVSGVHGAPLATSEQKPHSSSRRRQMQNSPAESPGFDVYEADTATSPEQEKPRRQHRRHREGQPEGSEDSMRRRRRKDGSGSSGRRRKKKEGGVSNTGYVGDETPRRHMDASPRPDHTNRPVSTISTGSLTGGGALMGYGAAASPYDPVRINIRTEPGTSVHIKSGPKAALPQAYPVNMNPQPQQSGQPQHHSQGQLNTTGSSVETEI